MLDRASPDRLRDGPLRSPGPLWPFVSMALAGLMGAAGVAVAAAGAHIGGGDLARTSSDFLLIHAAVILAIAATAIGVGRDCLWLAAAAASLALGAILFSGDLALAGLLDWRPWRAAAPIGGFCLIAGWILLAIAAARTARAR